MLTTQRLTLSRLSYDDCEFIYELVNEPCFKRFIGDKGVHTRDDARGYLRDGPIGSYERHGYGLFLVCHSDDGTKLGICGLVKRDGFDDPDLGFAFLNRHWHNGYAFESSVAVLDYGRKTLGLGRIIAMADKDNRSSVQLLEKLGFTYEKMVRMAGDTADVCLFGLEH